MRRRDFLIAAGGMGGLGFAGGCGGTGNRASVGAKNFSESVILGEVIAQLLDAAGVRAARRFHLTTFLLHAALTSDELDCYVEYTGTALAAVLKEDFAPGETRDALHGRVRSLYRERFGLVFGPPIGFANDFALAMRRDRARELGVSAISDLVDVPEVVLAAGHEFLAREDGLPGLAGRYGFPATPRTVPMELGLVYRAVESGAADVAVANSTDGRIARLDLIVLEDDLGYFPPYEAAVVYRETAPAQVAEAARLLGGAIGDDAIRRLNAAVDQDGRQPEEIAAEFIRERRLTLPPA